MVTITIDIDTAREFARACLSGAAHREIQGDSMADLDTIALDALAEIINKECAKHGNE
jgi:hypothetical protein